MTVDALDLTACDREPIRTPGAIQSHGVLVAIRRTDFTVLQASTNAESLIGVHSSHLTGRPLAALLGAAQTTIVRRALEGADARGQTRADAPVRVTLAREQRAARFDVTISRTGDVVILEFEPASERDALSLSGFQALVRQTMSRVRGATTLHALGQAVAEQMRIITGYDRVWVYRFHEDWHGEVIAESKRPPLESWLGLHYPASDIPAQARALFVEHPLRVIADVDYQPAPLEPVLNPDTGTPLDLGGAILRSVSPVHLQYMRNMGTRASLVVSLVKDGRLWGLVSGHHGEPKTLAHEVRTVCEFLGQAFSIQLTLAETIDERDQLQRVRSATSALLSSLARDGDTTRTLVDGMTGMLQVTNATGAALVNGGRISTAGNVPDDTELVALVDWLRSRGLSTNEASRDVFETSALGTVFPRTVAYAATVSGMIACPLYDVDRPPPIDGGFLLWFREEQRQVISWAGNPEKPVQIAADGTQRLSPRGSFALWEQEVRGTAVPWRAWELDAARSLAAEARMIAAQRANVDRQAIAATTHADVIRTLIELAHAAAAGATAPGLAPSDAMAVLADRLDALVRNLAPDVVAGPSPFNQPATPTKASS